MKMSNTGNKNMVVYEGINLGKAVKNEEGIYLLVVKKPGKNIYAEIPVTKLFKDIIDKADKAG